MTREQAINVLTSDHPIVVAARNCGKAIYSEAIKTAVKALQEPEIVHCKDCEYWLGNGELRQCGLAGYLIGERGYCLYGKKAGEKNDR